MNPELPPLAAPHSLAPMTLQRLPVVRVFAAVMTVLAVLLITSFLLFCGVMIWLANNPQITGDYGGTLAGQ